MLHDKANHTQYHVGTTYHVATTYHFAATYHVATTYHVYSKPHPNPNPNLTPTPPIAPTQHFPHIHLHNHTIFLHFRCFFIFCPIPYPIGQDIKTYNIRALGTLISSKAPHLTHTHRFVSSQLHLSIPTHRHFLFSEPTFLG